MLEVAGEAATIAACVAMAAAPATQSAEEEPQAKASLSEERAEQLKALFDLFPKNKNGSIDVQLLDQVAIKEGPNETKVLSNLKDMDADKAACVLANLIFQGAVPAWGQWLGARTCAESSSFLKPL